MLWFCIEKELIPVFYEGFLKGCELYKSNTPHLIFITNDILGLDCQIYNGIYAGTQTSKHVLEDYQFYNQCVINIMPIF
jgi:hypothetical protein